MSRDLAVDAIKQMMDQSYLLHAVSNNKKVHGYASEAMKHCNAALGIMRAHDANPLHSLGGATEAAGSARELLRLAASTHADDLESGDAPSSGVLDIAKLGKAHELHQQLVDDINEGKNNGS